MKKRALAVTLVITMIMGGTVTGCSNAATTSTSSSTADSSINSVAKSGSVGENKVYGVSVMTHNNPFFVSEVDGVKAAVANDAGAEVLAPDPANDITKQVQQISELIARKVDVLIIDPVDSEGIEPSLQEAKKAGIPVINIDSMATNQDLVDSFLVSDNVDAGVQAGRTLCEAIGGKGEIAIVNWSALKAVRDRTDGLKKVIKEEYPDIVIVADQDANGVVENAQNITDTFLQAHPNLKGIFAINDPTAQGVIAAIQGVNRTGEIAVVSVDGSQNGIDMIKAGQLLCSPVQQPAKIGEMAVEIAKHIFAGEKFETQVIIPVINITATNVTEWDKKTY